MRLRHLLVVLLLAAALAGCTSKPSTPTTGTSTTPTGTATDTVSHTTTTSGTTTSQSTTSGSSSTSSSSSSGGSSSPPPPSGNSTTAKPTPVSATCNINLVTVSIGGSASCGSGDLVSDTGGAFTAAKVTFTFQGATASATFSVVYNGTTLASKAGATGPVVIDVPADKVPSLAKFSLGGYITQTGATTMVQGMVKFDLS